MPTYDTYLREHREEHLNQLMNLLRIPSVSTLPDHKPQMAEAAGWLANRMRQAGLENVQVMPTGGHPVVYGEWLHAPGAPTALIYGHYDVQPVDPLNLWDSPPFEPQVRDGKLYARGATDDKGQVFMHVLAVEALMRTEGRLPVNVKFLIEGEEEIGSKHLTPFITAHKDLLKADFAVVSDGSMWAPGVPAIDYGLRGLMAMEVHVKGARGDLHSGTYGGTVQNGIHALVHVLASLRDEHGHITVPGFYDKVRPLEESERQEWRRLGFDPERYKEEAGVTELFGEPEFTPLERTWARPTLEINGIWGGFQGEGVKTVLVSEAHAKITCRLVPDQDPEEIYQLVCRAIEQRLLPGASVRFVLQQPNKPVLVPRDHPAIRAAARALKDAYGKEAVLVRTGGSIPVVETFQTHMGICTVLMGFGLETENLHAPNEHFHLVNFDTGLRALCAFWHEVASESAHAG